MKWSRIYKPKSSSKKNKYRCWSCGFTAKGSTQKCPSCGSTKIDEFSSKFRFSSRKRKNPCRVKRSKMTNKLINGNKESVAIRYSNNIHTPRRIFIPE